MTSPLRQFQIISLIGVTVTLLSLLYFHVQLTEDYLREFLDSYNRNLSTVLRNSLLASGLEQELVDGDKELSAPIIEKISSILDQALRWVPVVKVKIYSGDGIVLFSSKAEEIGEDETNNLGYRVRSPARQYLARWMRMIATNSTISSKSRTCISSTCPSSRVNRER